MKNKALLMLLMGAISLPSMAATYIIKTEGRFASWEQAESIFADWEKVGGHYNCAIDSPLSSNQTANFYQKWQCDQDFTREVTLREYDEFTDRYRVVGTTSEDDTFKESEDRLISVSQTSWVNSGGAYSCSGYSPATTTVRKGKTFTQTRTCRQNQSATVSHYLDGSKVHEFATSRYIYVTQSRTATGNRAPVWTYCSGEHGRCYFNTSERRAIRYGAGGRYTYKNNMANGTACSNSVFGDPYPGVGKACWYDK